MSIQWYRGAFNGAAVSQRRKQALRPHKLRMKIPSMGPPFLNGGNRARAALHAPEARPSMGPPFLNGGNRNCRVANGSPITTFNGAAVSQRRKRGVLSAEEQAAQHLQWGRRFSTAETPWDCRQIRGHRITFNGAAVSQRRKQEGQQATAARIDFLQWGRRFSTAETNLLQGLVQLRGAPSMGPPFLNGGNLLSCELLDALELLQWGRRFSTAETAMILSAPPSSRRLQWGRRSSTAETRTGRGGVGVGASLQWGRRFSTAETPWDCRQIRGHRITFNGAAVSQRRKQEGQQATAARIDILQWGRRFSTAETRHDRDGTDGGFSFNGAAVSQRRKLICFRVSFNCVVPLQWGRRFSTAETC